MEYKTPFRRYVQIGRVCQVSFGPDYGKLCVIIDVLDANTAMVGGPESITGVRRQKMPFKRLALTDIVIECPRGCRDKTLTKYFKKAQVEEKFAKSAWARRQKAKEARANSTDLDRFKLMKAKQRRNHVVSVATKKLTPKA